MRVMAREARDVVVFEVPAMFIEALILQNAVVRVALEAQPVRSLAFLRVIHHRVVALEKEVIGRAMRPLGSVPPVGRPVVVVVAVRTSDQTPVWNRGNQTGNVWIRR